MKILVLEGSISRPGAPASSVFIQERVKALNALGAQTYHGLLLLKESPAMRMAMKLRRGVPISSARPEPPPGVDCRLVGDTLLRQLLVRLNLPDPGFTNRVRRAVGELIRASRPDVIQLHWAYPIGEGVLWAAREAGIPLALTCHGSEINLAMADPQGRSSILKLLHAAQTVEFVSGALLKTAMERGYDGKNAVVVPNGFDPALFHLEGRLPQPVPVVGFVGNLIPVKGADRLPSIFAQITAALNGAVVCMVVGDGVLKDTLIKETTGLPVIFTGRLSHKDAADCMRAMDVLLLPSRSEGYPCVVREAMACGARPVVTRVGGSSEAAGEMGLLADASLPEDGLCGELSKAVLRALNQNVPPAALSDYAKRSSWEACQTISLANCRRAVEEWAKRPSASL